MGYIIPEQALLQVGQTVLKAGVQVAAQGAFQGYEKQAGGLMAAWGKNFMGEATVNFLQQLTTNTLNGAIDAVELSYDDDGNLEGLGFDMERWGESVYGVRALAGYAGSFARSATQSLLKGTAVGFLGEGANNYNALIKTASALVGEGVGSLIDGEFSINVLNLTDILSPFIEDKDLLAKMDMGLFSMNFARDKNGNLKTTSRINSAGANMGGLVGLARSVAGLTEAYDNIRIGLSGADEKTAIALRGISTNGQEASQSLFDQIMSGETTLQEAYRVAVGEMAKTTATEYGKEISLNMEDLNGFELGVVLAHEAMRNGRNDGEEGQRLETIDAVLAHSDHAMQVLEKYGLGALGYQMVQEAIDYAKMQNGEISQEDFEAYVDGTYDSTEDFWRLMEDGTIEFDGRTDLYYDPDGDGPLEEVLILDLYATGLESSFAELMGYAYSTAREKEQVAKDMKDLGLSPNESRTGYNSRNARTWYWDVAENNGVTVGDAPSDFLKDLTVTGRFEKEHLYNVLLEREEVHEKNFHIFDNIASAVGYSPMTYDEWDIQFEIDYTEELFVKDLTIERRILPQNRRSAEDLTSMEGVVIHWTGNASGRSAMDIYHNFATSPRQSNSNYGIGYLNGEILLMVPEGKVSWASGGRRFGRLYATPKMQRLFPVTYEPYGDPNRYTVSIEVNPMRDRTNTNNTTEGFFTRNAYDSSVMLVADILYRNNLDANTNTILRHYDSTWKDCPKFMQPDTVINNESVEYNREYLQFIERVDSLIQIRRLRDEERGR